MDFGPHPWGTPRRTRKFPTGCIFMSAPYFQYTARQQRCKELHSLGSSAIINQSPIACSDSVDPTRATQTANASRPSISGANKNSITSFAPIDRKIRGIYPALLESFRILPLSLCKTRRGESVGHPRPSQSSTRKAVGTASVQRFRLVLQPPYSASTSGQLLHPCDAI